MFYDLIDESLYVVTGKVVNLDSIHLDPTLTDIAECFEESTTPVANVLKTQIAFEGMHLGSHKIKLFFLLS